jgi:hypothetical protein
MLLSPCLTPSEEAEYSREEWEAVSDPAIVLVYCVIVSGIVFLMPACKELRVQQGRLLQY